MRLALIGPGSMSIPPKGWGAVESLIWDYYIFIQKFHPDVDVHIINEKEEAAMLEKVRELKPDVIHLHYDNHIERLRKVRAPVIIVTSHYAYIDQQDKYKEIDLYFQTFTKFVNSGYYIFCLSPSIRDIYARHDCDPELLYVHHNGANELLYRYTETPALAHRSAYVGKIEPRKRQFDFCVSAGSSPRSVSAARASKDRIMPRQ